MTDMPWRLQLAMAAMQGDLARNRDVLDSLGVTHYFRLADAMLAVHERTAKISAPTAEDK